MGKKTRSRGRRRPNNHSNDNNSNTGSGGTQPQPPQSLPLRPVVQRLRHADPTTRHAALTALADHPAWFFKTNNNNNNNNTAVLTTVSELVSSAAAGASPHQQQQQQNVLCATAAATCLGNVLEYIAQQGDDNNNNLLEERTVGWLILLLTRLQQQQQQQILSAQQSQPQQQQHSLQLVQECLRATVLLLETNPLALQRLVRHHAKDFFTLATQLLLLSSSSTTQQQLCDEPLTTTTITMWVCRGLHSTFDDNPALLVPFLAPNQESQSQSQTFPALTLLQALYDNTIGRHQHPANSSTTTTTTTPEQPTNTMAVLHAVGAWLAAWSCIIVQNSAAGRQIHPAVTLLLQQHVTTAVTILGHTIAALDYWHTLVPHYRERLHMAWNAHQAERADSQLEREILQQQHAKQEPARLIARRLQQQQQSQQQPDHVMDTETTTTTTTATGQSSSDTPNNNNTNDSNNKNHGSDCAAQAWDEVVTEWHQQLQPIRLALEIVTNLLGSASAGEPNEMDDDDEDATMSDAELDQNKNRSLPEPLVTLILQNQLPDRLLQFVNRLVEENNAAMTSVNMDDDNDNVTGGRMVVISESFTDVLSKATAGLGHCMTHWWSSDYWQPEPAFLGSVLRRVAAWDTSALVVALQQQLSAGGDYSDEHEAPALVDPAFVMELLSKHSDDPESVRDCVCMLGLLLCNQAARGPRSAITVHESVVRVLLHVSTPPLLDHVSDDDKKKTISQLHQHPSAMVLAEVLNVLMDIYSDDDCHPAAFAQLNVLRHFQQSLPLLKQRVAIEELTKNSGPELIEAWKETAMNAGRFIQYKKGHADS